MNVRIQPERFAQNAGPKKCQETPLYLKKRNKHKLGGRRSYRRELADGIHHRGTLHRNQGYRLCRCVPGGFYPSGERSQL